MFAYVYGLVFLVNGITSTGSAVSFQAYLLDMAPAREPPYLHRLDQYRAGTMDFLTIAAGQAVDVWGYSRVFLAAAVLIAIGASAVVSPQGFQGRVGSTLRWRMNKDTGGVVRSACAIGSVRGACEAVRLVAQDNLACPLPPRPRLPSPHPHRTRSRSKDWHLRRIRGTCEVAGALLLDSRSPCIPRS